MSSRIDHERRIVMRSQSPLAHHSMNQEKTGWALNGERRLEVPQKIWRRERKKRRKEVLQEIKKLPFSQVLFDASVENARKGEATPEEAIYVSSNLDNLNLVQNVAMERLLAK